MDLGIPYAKTDLAWSMINERNAQLGAGLRALLIMMDGKKPLTAFLPAIKALSLKMEDVQLLLERGLLAPCVKADAVRCPAPVAAALATATAPQEAPKAVPHRSLAAAKFYALEQIARMLGRGDEALRLDARQVVCHPSLMDWLVRCEREIERVAGLERARLFMARTLDLVPEPTGA